MDIILSIAHYLKDNSPVVIGLASLVAVALQYLINRYASIGKLTNYVLGLAALPGVTGAVAYFVAGLPAQYTPIIAIVGQFVYAFNEKYKAKIVSKATAPVENVLPDGV